MGGGAVVVSDVPPNCTVVGIPGRVVVREGERVEAVDLHHEDLPDPVIEMFRSLQRRVDKLESRLAQDEADDGRAVRRCRCPPSRPTRQNRVPSDDPPISEGEDG